MRLLTSRELVVGKEEAWARFSFLGGPRPGELLAEEGVEDDTPEGVAFLERVHDREDERAKEVRDLLSKESTPYNRFREKLGTLLSLADRLGSCWWGCSGNGHIVEYIVASSAGNAMAAFRLMEAGYYDEAIALARQIAERANLLQLFVFDDQSFQDWSEADDDARRKQFRAVAIRLRLEELGLSPIMSEDHYRYLSGFGIHPGRAPQYFGEKFPPTVGGVFRPRGLLIVVDELSYAAATVTGAGVVLLSDNDRIPADRIIEAVREVLEEQQKLHKLIHERPAESRESS
jgi:hypothetical protein